MLDTHAIARTLTDAGIDSEPADAITATVRQAAGQGEHVTRTELRAELVSLESRLVKWIVGAGRMRALLLNVWLRPPVVGLSVSLGICGGSWVTMHWLSTRIQARIRPAAALDLDIEEARQTMAQLEATTWGIALQEIEGERFMVLCCRLARWPIRPGPWALGPGLQDARRDLHAGAGFRLRQRGRERDLWSEPLMVLGGEPAPPSA